MNSHSHSSTVNLMFLPHPTGILTTIKPSSEAELRVSKKKKEGKQTNEKQLPDSMLFPAGLVISVAIFLQPSFLFIKFSDTKELSEM